ncbi:MAG: tetratricopeptide repeat protein [Chitinophagaceae bacterium]|nr:tetratricopeptide repeat protein [Chitinophagaceae bacterium]
MAAGIVLVVAIYSFGKTVPSKKSIKEPEQHSENDGHDHGPAASISIDTILLAAKKQLSPDQVLRLNMLENSVSRGDVKDQQLKIYHQLSHFWGDSARIFEPYAWYEAEAARLENSENSLTFAARLFLENLQQDSDPELRKWKALQAKDLFERSLTINPDNDSAKVGLGACYLFGNISDMPMEGLGKIREVIQKDSTNVYAQMMLAKGSVISGQYDKAISRLETVIRLEKRNIEAILMLADVLERTGDKKGAVKWYHASLEIIQRPDARVEIEKRITELSK